MRNIEEELQIIKDIDVEDKQIEEYFSHLSLSIPLSLSHTHTLPHSLYLSLYLSVSLSLSLSLSFSLYISLSISRNQSMAHTWLVGAGHGLEGGEVDVNKMTLSK